MGNRLEVLDKKAFKRPTKPARALTAAGEFFGDFFDG